MYRLRHELTRRCSRAYRRYHRFHQSCFFTACSYTNGPETERQRQRQRQRQREACTRDVAELLPVCKVDSNRSRVSVRDVVDSYHRMKVAIESDVRAFELKRERDQEAPGRENLNTELRWLIEDSVRSAADQWQSLFAEKKKAKEKEGGASEGDAADEKAAAVLHSRLSVAELEMVWRYRLEERVPIQYILGTVSWYDFELSVGPGVLIPRPETEVLLDYVLKASKGKGVDGGVADQKPQRWLDLGTGSGALAIGLALHAVSDHHNKDTNGTKDTYSNSNLSDEDSPGAASPSIEVVAVEASPGAAKYTRENIRKHDLEDVVRLVEGSWFQPLGDGEQFDGIVSNPPYIREEEMGELQAEVRLHEPHQALFGGVGNGMDDLIHIIEEAPKYLVPGGILGLETGGPAQAYKLKELVLSSQGEMTEVEVKADLQGVERFLTARRKMN